MKRGAMSRSAMSRGAVRRIGRRVRRGSGAAAFVAFAARGAVGQAATAAPATGAAAVLARAFDLEGAGRAGPAAAEFRRALVLADAARDADARAAALLGLERAWSDAGQLDSTLAVVADALREHPADATAHGIAVRTLLTLHHDAEARAAYERWRRVSPSDAGPYLEFARLLLDAGQRAAADSVLADAGRAPIARASRRLLAPATARSLAAGGAWGDAARVWRDVLAGDPDYANAVVFSLRSAPEPQRDAVVAVLAPTPADRGAAADAARYAAAALLVVWHRATAAWAVAAALPRDAASRDPSALELWRVLAAELDAAGARREGADAWQRVLDASPPGGADAREAFARAAEDALLAGDPAGALALLDRRPPRPNAAPNGMSNDMPNATRFGAPAPAPAGALRVRALAALGRLEEAERAAAALPADARPAAADALAAAWVARGDLARAHQALAGAGADSGEAAGWLALAGGDLRGARAIFAHAPPAAAPSPGLLADVRTAARTALARARADSAPELGAALVAAARGDAPAASAALEHAARALPDAAAPLLAAAADAAAGAGDRVRAATLWQRLLADASDAPEAPAAELAWARALLAAGDRAAARTRFEHLVVTYPESALVPLARRELDRLGAA